MSTLPIRRVTMLPSAHMDAAHSVRAKPASVMPVPLRRPISVSPAAATSKPSNWPARTRSPSSGTANNRVKKACACSTSEASPAGMPADMA
ncbi:hypothetical protein D3C77_582830 [compost metagenome]